MLFLYLKNCYHIHNQRENNFNEDNENLIYFGCYC